VTARKREAFVLVFLLILATVNVVLSTCGRGRRDASVFPLGNEAAPMSQKERFFLGKKMSLGKVDEGDLILIEGIGPARAGKIIEWRDERGRDEGLEGLADVPGFGEKSVRKLGRFVQ
jgi:DNA uptake protein ComE-like DNA-binding protein